MDGTWNPQPRTPAGARACVVIPARIASTRLPRKLLLRDTGMSVLEHTYRAACRAQRPEAVWIAAADDEIAREAQAIGACVQRTDPEAPSGTDRVAEVARDLEGVDIIVNVQADEPEIQPEQIDQVVELLERDATASMSTLAVPIRSPERLRDPACVKVVFDRSGRAIYFSRAAIPYAREWDDRLLDHDPPTFWQHLGIYAYRREFLLELAKLPRSPLEAIESLEQLRVLQHGHAIQVGTTSHGLKGIDTLEDYRAFVARAGQMRRSA